MRYIKAVQSLTTMSVLAAAKGLTERPQALVYRGDAACPGCPEAVAHLLETSPYHFNVTFCGPAETLDITPETLAQASVYAYPGGPGTSLNNLLISVRDYLGLIIRSNSVSDLSTRS